MPNPLEKLNLLKYFFAGIDDSSLLDGDESACRALRRQVGDALVDLLLTHRPFMEVETGLAWPYREFARRVPLLEGEARRGRTEHIRQQARLFLALLPFPGQWRWLTEVSQDSADDPEIKALLSSERQRIEEKIHKKKQRVFKLRNFCQVLKRPNLPDEKGILRIFSLPYLFADVQLLHRLNRLYLLYVEPPWGVVARHAWLRAFGQLTDPVLFGVAGHEDAAFLESQGGIATTRLCHGDFLEEEDLPPTRGKEFDLVFVATYDEMERKRHGFMLDLLSRPPLTHTTALFIGRGSEQSFDLFRRQVEDRGLGGRVEALANLRRNEVSEQLARCRIGMLTSVNENGCRCIYEYMRADLPTIVTSSMAGCNFDLINSHTGCVASDKALPGAILHALSHPESFSPRAWFLNHSGSRNSSLRLNAEMKNLFARLGYCWRGDIVPLGSSGATRYVDEAHARAFAEEFEQLLEILQPFLSVRLSV